MQSVNDAEAGARLVDNKIGNKTCEHWTGFCEEKASAYCVEGPPDKPWLKLKDNNKKKPWGCGKAVCEKHIYDTTWKKQHYMFCQGCNDKAYCYVEPKNESNTCSIISLILISIAVVTVVILTG